MISVRVNFNENVQVSGIPKLELSLDSTTKNVSYSSGSGTKQLTFGYVVEDGDVSGELNYKAIDSLKLNGGSIKNAGNNDVDITLPDLNSSKSLAGNKDLAVEWDCSNSNFN